MKALVQDSCMSAEGVVHIEEIDMPVVEDDEVLVRVRAASGKMYGWDLPTIVQSIGRVTARFRKPKVPGLDFAGDVEAIGKEVTQFRPGAAVFGWSEGALAEYVSATKDALAEKPTNVSYAEAATIATAGFTALQALRKGQVESGHHVLVVGASGGVGTFAVQLAKALGAEVTGVCSTMNLDLVRSLAPTTLSTTPRRTPLEVVRATTRSWTWPAITPCPIFGRRYAPMARWSWLDRRPSRRRSRVG